MAEVIHSMPPSVEPDESAFQHSSPQSLKQSYSSPPAPSIFRPAQNIHDYNFSAAVYDESATPTDADDNPTTEEDELEHDQLRRLSGRSSISSFPASVTQRVLSEFGREELRTPSTPIAVVSQPELSLEYGTSPRLGNHYASAFRNPSSVRALQMRDELLDDSDSVIHHRRSGSRVSVYSHRSSNSVQTSPSKRGSRSHHSSPSKSGSKLKKEFPLILLHCTLLPSSLAPHINVRGNDVLQDVLPPEYRKRWRMLQDRLMDGEISTRGILIPHPKEDYELLEERVLETLDLEKPRIRHNHFIKSDKSSVDSGFDSASQTDEDSDIGCTHAEKCPDCGKKLPPDHDPCRKWEIKVYAANGLMRAGAWGAAWREMEKVDVEVGVWMPDEIRREVEARITASTTHDDDQAHGVQFEEYSNDVHDAREREIYGEAGRAKTQDEIDGLFDEPIPQAQTVNPQVPHNVSPDLQSLLEAYLRSFHMDRKSIIIAILSITVLFYAMMNAKGTPEPTTPMPSTAVSMVSSSEVHTTTVVSTSTYTALSTMTVTQAEVSSMISSQSIAEADPIEILETDSLPIATESFTEITTTVQTTEARPAVTELDLEPTDV